MGKGSVPQLIGVLNQGDAQVAVNDGVVPLAEPVLGLGQVSGRRRHIRRQPALTAEADRPGAVGTGTRQVATPQAQLAPHGELRGVVDRDSRGVGRQPGHAGRRLLGPARNPQSQGGVGAVHAQQGMAGRKCLESPGCPPGAVLPAGAHERELREPAGDEPAKIIVSGTDMFPGGLQLGLSLRQPARDYGQMAVDVMPAAPGVVLHTGQESSRC